MAAACAALGLRTPREAAWVHVLAPLPGMHSPPSCAPSMQYPSPPIPSRAHLHARTPLLCTVHAASQPSHPHTRTPPRPHRMRRTARARCTRSSCTMACAWTPYQPASPWRRAQRLSTTSGGWVSPSMPARYPAPPPVHGGVQSSPSTDPWWQLAQHWRTSMRFLCASCIPPGQTQQCGGAQHQALIPRMTHASTCCAAYVQRLQHHCQGLRASRSTGGAAMRVHPCCAADSCSRV